MLCYMFEPTAVYPEYLSDLEVLICPSDTADVRMRMFNADGSESQMCGNGIRCVAKYVYDHKVAEPGGEFSVPGQGTFDCSLRVETGRGILTLGLEVGADDKIERVSEVIPYLRTGAVIVGEGGVLILVLIGDDRIFYFLVETLGDSDEALG